MIQSQPYSVPRPVLARLTALYYLRTFWFILIGPFVLGVILMSVGPNSISRFFGAILAIWPATVFMRAFLLVGKNAKVWSKKTVMTVSGDAFLFESESSKLRLRFEGVRKVFPLAGYQILQTRTFGFVPVPTAALPENTDLSQVIRSKS